MAKSSNGFMKGFVLGGIIGSVLGVLLAPKSGQEMREEISGEAEKFLTKAKEDIEIAKKAAMKSFEEGKAKIIEKLVVDKEKEAKESEAKTKRKRTTRRRPRPTKSQPEE